MDPQRWKEVRAAFDELVELEAPEQARRLTALGTTDPEFRDAVEILLRADADADAWLMPVESTLGSSQGDDGNGVSRAGAEFRARLEHALGNAYRLGRELGGGGMSRVFVAEETAFRRKVVVKVLPPELAEAISAKRFQREIQVAARLQHPHIVPLLSARDADGLLYYTMPFVEGESLRGRLRREGELPMADTVRIIRDVTSALAYAHRQGVVHRDIKPENVLLSEGGAVVADFGIAKALSASRAHGDGDVDTTVTELGMALGTPRYMAPEQATGNPACDHRADLYALGVVAYEMLAGRTPFEGTSAQQLMAAHAIEEPTPVEKLRRNTPPALAALVMRCLEKRPADRPQDAEQVLLALNDSAFMAPRPTLSSVEEATVASSTRRRARKVPWLIGGIGVMLGAGAGMAIATLPQSSADAKPTLFHLELPDSAAARVIPGRRLDVSPDGSAIAYIGGATQSIFVRALDDLTPRRLPGTEGAQSPAFSPDGQWIAFASGGRLRKVALRGGLPVVIADSVSAGPVWTDRNEIFFDWKGQIFHVSPNGGAVSLVARADTGRGITMVIASDALPGGEAALAFISENMSNDWLLGVVSLRDGYVTKLGVKGVGPRYENGYALFSRGTNIIAAPFSLRTHRFTGPEVPLPLQDTILPGFSTGDNGNLAYLAQGRTTLSLVAVGEDGRMRTLAGTPERGTARTRAMIPFDTATYVGYPRLSPDGRRVALDMSTGPFDWDVWVYDIPSRTLSRLTFNYSGVRPVGWMPDGRSVVFMARDSGHTWPTRLVSQPWDRSAPARDLMQISENTHDVTISPRERYAAFTRIYPLRPSDIWLAPLDTPSVARMVVARGKQPRFSQDGALIAYTSDETGNDEAYIQTLRAPVSRLQVSTGGGWQPIWSADGRYVYYRSPGYMMRATIGRDPDLHVTRRDTLFQDGFEQHNMTNYDVFPGGKEMLMIRGSPGPVHAGVVPNWPALLRQRVVTR